MSTTDATQPVRPPVDEFVPRRKMRLATLLLGAIFAFGMLSPSSAPVDLPALPVVTPLVEVVTDTVDQVIPGTASAEAAHITYTQAKGIARDDCGRAWDWDCYKFPTAEDTLWPYTIHYQERRPWWASPVYLYRRNCYTYWLSGYYNEHRKYCAASF